MTTIGWDAGSWTHEPAATSIDGDDLLVTAVESSDAWRNTSYGFVHDTEHALLTPMPAESAVEVDFVAEFSQQFDQAGVFLRADAEHWVKAGVEFADGTPNLGAVVTQGRSDWSSAPVPEWRGRRVTIRASRSEDALTVRARVGEEPFRFVRPCPLEATRALVAGPYLCAPTRSGLRVRFHRWSLTSPDASLH